MAWLLLAAGCHAAPQQAPVPIQGNRGDIDALTGVWEGRYWAESGGRHGEIVFRLGAGADTARGQVEMTFSPSLWLYRPETSAQAVPEPPGPCTTIDIAVVRVQGSRVRGTLAPYWDPDCDCHVTSVFEGDLLDDRIEGVFTTHRSGAVNPELSGRWVVTRQRS